jgi:hypothetical protein
MIDRTWFADLPEDFEESVRIDRDDQSSSTKAHREQAIESYHVTDDSQRFLQDFINRLLGETEDMRSGSNYWLYGYYGSGKSHLLTVLDGLMDTEWLQGRSDEVWKSLLPGSSQTNNLETLRHQWKTVHDAYHVIPISVNLLKYQGQKQRSFSEIVLRHAHQNPLLTGIDDEISSGLSSQLEVAYFEDWYQTTDEWEERQARAATVIGDKTPAATQYEWESETVWADIQQYSALSDVVLPTLFESVTGTRDGFTDLKPSDIDPEAVVSRLESLREDCESRLAQPVKLVLLLDEVSLFIGTNFERLTELQTLAENINNIGDESIQLVATAQAKIEDVQPKFAAHGADFSIVKDRFPHRYQLPSKHVGDIAKRRLVKKSAHGEQAVRQLLADADIKPSESVVYNEIKQDTKPSLGVIDSESLVEFYPFLPYHAPLFLEILFHLRREAPDPAKSIFSGTARAILALMHGLLLDWIDEGAEDRIISLVDFFELIEPELREILSQDMRVIQGTEDTTGIVDEIEDVTSDLQPFDLRVAKAVLLLQHVHNIIPLTEGNLAVAVMNDLNGQSWISMTNRVETSLDRLQKFIRPTRDEGAARYRFATPIERTIYDDAEENADNKDWDEVLKTLDNHLWDDIIQSLSLPESVPYKQSHEEYSVSYDFAIDGTSFTSGIDADDGLGVDIAIRGIRPDKDNKNTDGKTLRWDIGTEGLDDLRERLVEWWALRDAVKTRETPPAVTHDLEQRATAVQRKLTSALSSGTFAVKGRKDISFPSKAVEKTVDVVYPDDFHPEMLKISEERLQQLRQLNSTQPLPAWADTIQVPRSDHHDNQGKQTIQRNVFSLTGRQLKGRKEGLNLNTVLDGIVEEKPFYREVKPALRAIIWGFCREGRLVPTDEDGNTLENATVLQLETRSPPRLKLLPRIDPGGILEEGGFKQTTESIADGLIRLEQTNEEIRSKLTGLREDVMLVSDTDIRTGAIAALLQALGDDLTEKIEFTNTRLQDIKSQENLEDAVEQTNTTQAWLEEVVDVWNRRLPTLQRVDTVLTIGAREFAWIDADAQTAIANRATALDTFTGTWWTVDGWSTLSAELVPDLVPELERSWETFVADRDLRPVVDRSTEQQWVQDATDLPAGVHRGFEQAYIAPARQLLHWYTTIEDAIATLAADSNIDALVEAADEVAQLEPLTAHVGCTVSAVAAKLETLATLVGDKRPEDVDQVGIIPADRTEIETRVARLVDDKEPDVTETDEGVILR